LFSETRFQSNTFETRFLKTHFGFANLSRKVVDKIFSQEFCLINQLQTIFLKGKLVFEMDLALRVKSKAFKA